MVRTKRPFLMMDVVASSAPTVTSLFTDGVACPSFPLPAFDAQQRAKGGASTYALYIQIPQYLKGG
jgi:hypothetical protein